MLDEIAVPAKPTVEQGWGSRWPRWRKSCAATPAPARAAT